MPGNASAHLPWSLVEEGLLVLEPTTHLEKSLGDLRGIDSFLLEPLLVSLSLIVSTRRQSNVRW